MDETETYLKTLKQTVQEIIPINTANGTIPASIPALVATPFPPLKFKKIEKVCPKIEKTPNKTPISSN